MQSVRQGSIHLFRLAGVDLYLHWSWFLVAAYAIQGRRGEYSSIIWNIFEYLALFLIVLLHEFGHAMACRQVGGTANQILLWPFGGVAYVSPPQRPGATLWSIAAGPLVNVALAPVLFVAALAGQTLGWADTMPDAAHFLSAVLWIDVGLLVFNILPIYPLDGGQILRSLLWFMVGKGRSLLIATVLGFVGIVGFIGFAIWSRAVWLGAISIFLLMNCWGGLQHARHLLRVAKLPRRQGFACPSCRTPPPMGEFWQCGACGKGFDTFASGAVCPHCSTRFNTTKCLDCGEQFPMNEWAVASFAGLGTVSGYAPPHPPPHPHH
jgi:Zn-dependent protease